MDFFDKLGKTASETYKYTAEKTGRFAKETRLKMQISDKKSKIDDFYEQIGKKVYEAHIREAETNNEEEVLNLCNQIDILCSEIEAANNEILELKDKIKCKNCFFEMEKEYKYCPKCGQKREVEIQITHEGEIVDPENIE